MVPGAALLVLVFLMEQRTWAQYGPPSQPSMWAVPGAVISTGSDVSIFCRTPPGVTEVRLNKYVPDGKWFEHWFEHTPEGAQEVTEFRLQKMTHSNAGIYYCEYFKADEWSRSSDQLELVVTGVYKEKPSLTVDSGPQGFSGRNVTLLCHSSHSFDTFILCRGGNASFPQNCSHQSHNTFLISPLSPGHRRTYRCFGSYKSNPYLCSLPSDPLELSNPGTDNHTVIWASVAAVCFLLLLFLLLFCLCCHCTKCRATNGETRSQVKHKRFSPAMDMEEKNKYGDLEDSQPEDYRKVDPQVSAAECSQEVTYAQLRQNNFTEIIDPPPSNAPQGTSSQTCVYASLTLSQEESQS